MSRIRNKPFDYNRSRERSIGFLLIAMFLAFGVAAGAIVAFYFLPDPALLLGTSSNKNATRTVQIGELEFDIPLDKLVRSGSLTQREGNFADLVITWPQNVAASNGLAKGVSDFSDHFVLRLEPTDTGISQQQLLKDIYPVYFTGPPEAAFPDLQHYTFKPGSPYAPVDLYLGRIGDETVYILCEKPVGQAATPATCEHTISISENVQARSKFSPIYLHDWRRIDTRMRQLIRLYRRQ